VERTLDRERSLHPSLPLALAMARFFQASVEEIFNDNGAAEPSGS
jgi:DNA-binding XRE family transcriptional regulator